MGNYASGANFSYCCTTPTNGLPGGNDCIPDTPEFIDIIPPSLDYRLKEISPCIDAGINMPWTLAAGATDLDGKTRIIACTEYRVDIGCYEFSFTPFIDITNSPAEIEYSQTATEISGTNAHIDGDLGWTNDKLPAATNFFPQGFSTIVDNLVTGENYITVFGTNAYFQSTNSVVSIRRKTLIESQPQIASDTLIFPSANSELIEGDLTNIVWNFNKITDNLDGTNLNITKISVLLTENTNEVATVTNDVSNLLGEIPWRVPENLWGGDTNYVLKFDVVDSSSLTNSRIFWDNKFTIVPEPFYLLLIIYYFVFIKMIYLKKNQ